MQKHLIKKKTNKLLIFFTGFGCDEYAFEHLECETDTLILYNYRNLDLDFDFSKYKKFDLIAYSAGVFIASIMNFDFTINKRIAISGNPYLFDEIKGLSRETQNLLYNISEETAEDFARNYLIKTDKEWNNFHNSKRTIESCKQEFNSLKEIYRKQKQNIKDQYDNAIFGENDILFNITEQKDYYGKRLKIESDARHNLFFRITNYADIYKLAEN